MGHDNRFSELNFNDFGRLASDPALSKYEKIGFPDSYREGREGFIFEDIKSKLSNLDSSGGMVLDIGPGCSDLPEIIMNHCEEKGHQLYLVDNKEMLDLLPDKDFVHKFDAIYPHCPGLVEDMKERFDVVLCYSVLHYIILDAGFFRFLDASLSLLAPGGQFLIGDIPNVSKRKRFLCSDAGVAFHRRHMNTEAPPSVHFNRIEHDSIDDSIVIAVIMRARSAGFDAYLLPQRSDLPMANRREDVLIVRP